METVKKTIPSFCIDHTRLTKGVYLSRVDLAGKDEAEILTFDIRVKTPYKEPAMTPEVAHTLEHLCATWLRNHNDEDVRNRIVYFGPMGCLTGFYLIIQEQIDNKRKVKPFVKEMIDRIVANYDNGDTTIPGCSEIECGNYKLNNLKAAIETIREFSAYYDDWKEEYPEMK